MRHVVHREIGGNRRRKPAGPSRRSASSGGQAGFGRLLAQLFSASSSLDRSRARVGNR